MADAILSPSGIYAIRNAINGKFYVGSSVCMAERIRTHKRMLEKGSHHSQKLQRAWAKYGESAFEFLILESVRAEDLLLREQYWIDFHRSATDAGGYNICPTAGNILGVKRSAETREKLSAWQKGIPTGPMPDEIKKKIGDANRGKEKHAEWRQKLSDAHKGRPKDLAHREKLSIANMGNTHTDEARAKIGAGARGRIKSDEERAKLSAALRGQIRKPLTDEHKAKISAGSRGRKQTPESIEKRVASRKKTMLAKLAERSL
jgi:group I intron endonuclease